MIYRNGEEIPFSWENGAAEVEDRPEECGEYRYEIEWMGKRSQAVFLIRPEIGTLSERRCRFIAEKQQCRDERSCLDGAYLIYDNEEKCLYYNHAFPDHNGGRERIGMGVLLAKYLQETPDEKLEKSLDAYVRFVRRELFDERTGEVFNEVRRCQDWKRLYNCPWVCVLFLEMFRLKGDRWYLQAAYRVMEAYYRDNIHLFKVDRPLIKGLYIKVPLGSPHLSDVRRWYRSDSHDAVEHLEKYSLRNAVKYEYFYDKWVPAADVLGQLPEGGREAEPALAQKRPVELADTAFHYFLNVTGYRAVGEDEPYELARDHARDLLLNIRQVEFMRGVRDDLYRRAMENNEIIYYKDHIEE